MNYMKISDKLFNHMREEAIKIWQTYDDTHGYASEKIDYINSFDNVKDNYGTFIGMFDSTNQARLFNAVNFQGKQLIDYWTGGLVS